MATESVVLQASNGSIRRLTGVQKFHDAGYYGERVNWGTGETWDIECYNPDDLVQIPLGNGASGSWGNLGSGHGARTANVFFQCAPKAKLFQLAKATTTYATYNGENSYIGIERYCKDTILEYNILGIFCSQKMHLGKWRDQAYTNFINELKTFNFLVSAANEATSDYNEIMECDVITGVGACYVSGSKFVPENFTSHSELVDFAAPDRQHIVFAKGGAGFGGEQSGTSFSAPWLAGMMCLVNDFFIDKTGSPLTWDKMRQFCNDHVIDIGKEGFDVQSGNGAVVLPDPAEIDINAYSDTHTDTNPIVPGTVPSKYKAWPSTEPATLHGENGMLRQKTGVTKFHNAGYYGERVIMATGESWDVSNFNPDGLVYTPFGNGPGWGNLQYEHGPSTAASFFQVAPKAKLFQMDKIFGARTGKNCYCGLEKYCMDIIKECNILGIFCSFNMICDKYLSEKYTQLLDELKTFNFVISAGNDSSSDSADLMMCDAVTGVGACYLSGSKWKVESFTSLSDYVDFAAPDKQTIKFAAKEDSVIEWGKRTGTSFSAPWLLGQMALVDDFFIDKTGQPLTYKKMREFLNDHAVDIGDEGEDNATGLGVVVLPDPSEIDIDKYVESTTDTPLTPPEEEDKPAIDVDTERDKYKPFTSISLENNIYATVVPYSSIKSVGFAQCKQPTQSVKDWYNDQADKPQIVTNGGLFNMSGGTNILSFIENGVEQNYQNNFEGIGTKKDNLAHLVAGIDKDGDWWDFMSAYPVLVRDGKALTAFDKGNELNYAAARTALGVKANGDVVIITVDQPGVKFDKLAQLMEDQGAHYAINLDGGGSTYKMEFGKVTNKPTEERDIDNVFYVYLKEADDMSDNPSVVDLPEIELGVYYTTKEVEFKSGIDSSEDEKTPVIATLPVGSQVEVRMTNPWNGKMWLNIEYQYQYGYMVYDGENLSVEVPLPAIFRVKEDVGALKAKDKVLVTEAVEDESGNPVSYTVSGMVTFNNPLDLTDITVAEIDNVVVDASKLEYFSAYTAQDDDDDVETPEEPEEPVDDPVDDDPMDPEFVPGLYRVNVAEGTYLSVRAEPNNNGELIDKLYRDDEVPILCIENKNWGKIATIDGIDMYINMGYVIRLDDYTFPTVDIPKAAKLGVCVRGEAGLALGTIVVIESVDEDGTCTVTDSMIEDKYATAYVVPADAIEILCEYNNEEVNIPEKPEDPEPEVPEEPDDILDCFSDKDSINPEYLDNTRLMVSLGVFMKDDKFRPKDALTREEAAEVAGRLFKLITEGTNNQ